MPNALWSSPHFWYDAPLFAVAPMIRPTQLRVPRSYPGAVNLWRKGEMVDVFDSRFICRRFDSRPRCNDIKVKGPDI